MDRSFKRDNKSVQKHLRLSVELDAARAPAVAEIFQRYAEGGDSITDLVRFAVEKGMRTERCSLVPHGSTCARSGTPPQPLGQNPDRTSPPPPSHRAYDPRLRGRTDGRDSRPQRTACTGEWARMSWEKLEQVVAAKVLLDAFETSDRLRRLGIRHALVGGLAVGHHGHPRATKDVDFIVGDEAFLKTKPLLVFRDELADVVRWGVIDLLATTTRPCCSFRQRERCRAYRCRRWS